MIADLRYSPLVMTKTIQGGMTMATYNATALNYRGWEIFYFPVGGQHWRATQYGVGMCANNPEMLKRMIDRRIEDRNTRDGRMW